MRTPPLRLLVVLYFVLGIASIVNGWLMPASTPTGVQEAANEVDFAWLAEFPEAAQWVSIGALLSLVLLHFAGGVGLFFYKRWGRSLSVATTLALYALGLCVSVIAMGPFQSLFYDLSTLAWGGALALAYWSSAAKRFSGSAPTNIDG